MTDGRGHGAERRAHRAWSPSGVASMAHRAWSIEPERNRKDSTQVKSDLHFTGQALQGVGIAPSFTGERNLLNAG